MVFCSEPPESCDRLLYMTKSGCGVPSSFQIKVSHNSQVPSLTPNNIYKKKKIKKKGQILGKYCEQCSHNQSCQDQTLPLSFNFHDFLLTATILLNL